MFSLTNTTKKYNDGPSENSWHCWRNSIYIPVTISGGFSLHYLEWCIMWKYWSPIWSTIQKFDCSIADPTPRVGWPRISLQLLWPKVRDFAIFCRSRQIQESTLECLWTSAQDIWTVFHRHEDAVPTPLEGSGADGGKPSPTQPNQTQSCLTLISKWRGRIDPNLASQCWGQLWKPHLSCSGDVTTQLNHEW